MWGREANDSGKSHEDLAGFQEQLNNRGRETLDLGTNHTRALNSVPQVFAECVLGAMHLLGPKCWVNGQLPSLTSKSL